MTSIIFEGKPLETKQDNGHLGSRCKYMISCNLVGGFNPFEKY